MIGHDSDPLDEEMRKDGIEMIAPHRSNRCKPRTQDRRRLRRYMRRWLVERFFAWIQWQRRILVRWEYHTQNFFGFVQLACLVILFRRLRPEQSVGIAIRCFTSLGLEQRSPTVQHN